MTLLIPSGTRISNDGLKISDPTLRVSDLLLHPVGAQCEEGFTYKD